MWPMTEALMVSTGSPALQTYIKLLWRHVLLPSGTFASFCCLKNYRKTLHLQWLWPALLCGVTKSTYSHLAGALIKCFIKLINRFDLILDNVGGETEDWAPSLLQPWGGSKYITLVTPFLQNTDLLGIADGMVKTAASLAASVFKVKSPNRMYNAVGLFLCGKLYFYVDFCDASVNG